MKNNEIDVILQNADKLFERLSQMRKKQFNANTLELKFVLNDTYEKLIKAGVPKAKALDLTTSCAIKQVL